MTHENLLRFAKAYAEGLTDGLSNNSTELDRKNDELIRRQDAILALLEKGQHSRRYRVGDIWELNFDEIREAMDTVPSAEPEIIYCKDCKKHNLAYGYYCNGQSIGIQDCCPLVEVRGLAEGHEFDYQFCAYAERKIDG